MPDRAHSRLTPGSFVYYPAERLHTSAIPEPRRPRTSCSSGVLRSREPTARSGRSRRLRRRGTRRVGPFRTEVVLEGTTACLGCSTRTSPSSSPAQDTSPTATRTTSRSCCSRARSRRSVAEFSPRASSTSAPASCTAYGTRAPSPRATSSSSSRGRSPLDGGTPPLRRPRRGRPLTRARARRP